MKKLLFFCLGSVLVMQNAFSDPTWTADSFTDPANRDKLSGQSFTGLKLSGKDLSKMNLTKCIFNSCTMTDVKLTGSDLTGSMFIGGSLDKVTIEGAILKDAQFIGTTISLIRLVEGDSGIVSYFPKSNDDKNRIVAFIGQQKDFSTKAKKGSTSPIDYQKAADSMSQLIPCMHFDLSKHNFNNADLSYYNFSGCNLSNADLSHCNITGTNFTSADLRKANLDDVVLKGPGCWIHISGFNFGLRTVKDPKDPILSNAKVSDNTIISDDSPNGVCNTIYSSGKDDKDAKKIMKPIFMAWDY